jgi:hypothetical protein
LSIAVCCAPSIWFVLFPPADIASESAPGQPLAAMKRAHLAARPDTETAAPSEIYRRLSAITPESPALRRHPAAWPRRLQVLTWLRRGHSHGRGNPKDETGLSEFAISVLVNAVSSLKDHCHP